MIRDDPGLLGGVLLLNWVGRGRLPRWVGDDNVGRVEVLPHLLVLCFQLCETLPPSRDLGSLDLMEDGIVRAINLVSSVHVGREEELVDALVEQLDLVRRGVSSEHCLLVQVVRVGEGATRMILCESQVVKVLLHSDDWAEGVEMFECREVGFDSFPQDGQWVIRFQVQVLADFGQDRGSCIGVVVPLVRLALDL